jgi:Cu+-exporting ATPase
MPDTAIDPVCGMTVDKLTAPAKAQYQGETYFFCSSECKTKFQEVPARYATQPASR